jgi:outer membrane cobalamin receptor
MNKRAWIIALTILLVSAVACEAQAQTDTSGRANTSAGFVALRADGNGVPALARVVTLSFERSALVDVLRAIMREADLELVFRADLPRLDRLVTIRESGITAAAALLRVLDGSGLRVLVSSSGQAVLVEAGSATAKGEGVLTGTLREAGESTPVPFADVEIVGLGRHATSYASGRFELRHVPAGVYSLAVRRIGYAATTVPEVAVAVGDETDITIEVTPVPTPLAAVVVTPGHFGMLERNIAAKQSLSREDIETKPQLGDDIFRAVHRLPGVSSHDMSAGFGVRGGEHRDLLVRLDGLELIEPFHLKDFEGGISIIDLGSIGGVDLITGGFGAEYGNRLGGVFDMQTLAVPPGGPRTSLGVSLTNVRAATQGSFANDRGRWLFTARRGYLDLALAIGNGNTAISPRYYDAIGKVEYELTPRTVVSAHVLHAGDVLNYVDENDEDEPTLDSEYGSSYAWLNVHSTLHDRLSMFTVFAAGGLDWERLGKRVRDPRFWGGLDVQDRRSFDFVGARQDWMLELSDRMLIKTGFDLRRGSADYDYLSWTENFVVQNGTVIARFDTTQAAASPEGTSVGAYLAHRVRPWQPLTLELGAEWSRHSHTDDSHVNPRVNLAWAVGRTTLRGAWGRYAQAQGLHELQVQDGVAEFFPAERAEHRVLSLEHSFRPGLDARIEAYERLTDNVRPRFVNIDNVDDLLPEVTQSRRRIDADEARARGIELIARKSGSRFDWTATYALASAEEHINGEWVPAKRDQLHAIGLDFSWAPAPLWRIAAAWKYHSGWPRTPQLVRADSLNNGGYFFTWGYGDYNSERLPAYHRTDIRVSRHFETRRGRVAVFLDVWNLFNVENARSVFTNVSGIRNGQPITFESIDSTIPRLPSFGVYWEF